MPAVVNAKLSQRMLRSYWSIPFTQELPGKNASHVRLFLTSTKKGVLGRGSWGGVPPSLASTVVALGEKGGSRGGTPLGEKHARWKGANHVADARWNVDKVGCEADL
jgi:hypothetical protein